MTVAVVASRTSTGIVKVRPWTSYCALILSPSSSSRALQRGVQQLVEHRCRKPRQRRSAWVGIDPVRRLGPFRVEDPLDERGQVGGVTCPLLLLRNALPG